MMHGAMYIHIYIYNIIMCMIMQIRPLTADVPDVPQLPPSLSGKHRLIIYS